MARDTDDGDDDADAESEGGGRGTSGGGGNDGSGGSAAEGAVDGDGVVVPAGNSAASTASPLPGTLPGSAAARAPRRVVDDDDGDDGDDGGAEPKLVRLNSLQAAKQKKCLIADRDTHASSTAAAAAAAISDGASDEEEGEGAQGVAATNAAVPATGELRADEGTLMADEGADRSSAGGGGGGGSSGGGASAGAVASPAVDDFDDDFNFGLPPMPMLMAVDPCLLPPPAPQAAGAAPHQPLRGVVSYFGQAPVSEQQKKHQQEPGSDFGGVVVVRVPAERGVRQTQAEASPVLVGGLVGGLVGDLVGDLVGGLVGDLVGGRFVPAAPGARVYVQRHHARR
jgi:hypothetical protein